MVFMKQDPGDLGQSLPNYAHNDHIADSWVSEGIHREWRVNADESK